VVPRGMDLIKVVLRGMNLLKGGAHQEHNLREA
jgi:hypothetical protein